jgi:release factor glutamine methyltransferase
MLRAVPESWTVRGVLEWMAKDFAARGMDSPRLDAELLVADALGIDRVRLYMDLHRPLVAGELVAVRARVARRRAREPVAYILGRREFYGRSFEVGPAVLVPRPETETLVERALELLPAEGEGRVLDLCTGSGAIAVTLAAARPVLRVDATDVSEQALEVARRNAARLGVAERVRFHRGDLFEPLPAGRRYDLVVANPPYVPDRVVATLQPEVAEHEPRIALAGGDDGLDVVRRIVAGASDRLVPGGRLLFEIGAGQAGAVRELLEGRLREVRIHPDLAGIERVVEVEPCTGSPLLQVGDQQHGALVPSNLEGEEDGVPDGDSFE